MEQPPLEQQHLLEAIIQLSLDDQHQTDFSNHGAFLNDTGISVFRYLLHFYHY
jgi:hypothetical protein